MLKLECAEVTGDIRSLLQFSIHEVATESMHELLQGTSVCWGL